ncbi:ubiquitin-like modifier-activating enzyme 1 isoform X2 [Lethenteron reissneri]|uniref:ubiquitin-like modifier-activating enzyme 1 isoform X2 n=1 Tax=Lethenteron reissneri TaxID=7753 RepID=UPI002AB6A0E4|nr:ubiquitin-like modifier-activating enzyme 1 isoform X2 [Lethenteron reissneri]
MSANIEDIDEEYFSRQLYVLGHEATRRIQETHVLVSGMHGLGLEVAKNVVLVGVGKVTVHDTQPLTRRDLSSQFYGREKDLQRNRAQLSQSHLKQLNEFVRVSDYSDSLTEEFLSQFQVVVLTNSSLSEQLRIGSICRAHGIKFIIASTRGLFGQIFCDFGDEFVVEDPSGKTITSTVASISKESPGVVTCAEAEGHDFENGDLVVFSGVRGMTELNRGRPRTVTVIDDKSISVGDTSDLSDYTEGGEAIKVNIPQTIKFLPLQEALVKPRFQEGCDQTVAPTLHKAFQALHRFQQKHNRSPRPHNQADADEVVKESAGVELGVDVGVELQEWLVRRLAFTAQGDLAPLNSFIGGVAAQEVIKACTGSFMPLNQWMYYSAAKCLPDEGTGTVDMEEACKPTDSRYDGQIAVFGKKFQEKLASLKYFLVGAGAIGCELLKNFAMMGLGEVTVTDMDHIERSNLHRQFLFRPGDVKKPKSEVAARAASEMNPDVRINPHRLSVGPASESVFGQSFFDELDGVATALDNIEAREYVDRQCVNHRKPLLESGTEGLEGSVQVVVPFLTQSYGCVANPTKKTIPLCSVRSNPSTTAHTLQWAKEEFEELFAVQVKHAKECVQSVQALGERVQSLSLGQASGGDASLEGCVAWARHRWLQSYHDHRIPPPPPATTTTQTSSSVRSPKCLVFSNTNALHVDYVAAAVKLYARVYGFPVPTDRASVERVLREDGSASEEGLGAELPTHESLGQLGIQPLVFDKDDDDHMNFIVAASNLRAETYGISPADKHKSKKIVGNIIPAIATCTAAVAGLVCLQLYAVAQERGNKRDFHNAFVDLGRCKFSMVNPAGPTAHQYLNKEWNVWDRIEVDGRQDMTLQQFLDHMKAEHELVVTIILCSGQLLYPPLNDDDLSKPLSQMLPMPAVPGARYLELVVACHGIDSEQELDVPRIKYILA